MSQNREEMGDRLIVPPRDRLDDLGRSKAASYDGLLLLFERSSVAPDPLETSSTAPSSLPEPTPEPTIEAPKPTVTPAVGPSDPNIGSQWHLLNQGQSGGTPGIDINVSLVWEDYSGAGVLVAVVDDGVEHSHPDLAANYDTSIDVDYGGNDDDAFPSGDNAHGTAVAGLIAADDNGLGGVGVAFD